MIATVAKPSHPALQFGSEKADIASVGAPKSLTTAIAVAVHPVLSVTVMLYIPENNPVAQLVVCVFGSSQAYVNGDTPLDTVTQADPSANPQLAPLVSTTKVMAAG